MQKYNRLWWGVIGVVFFLACVLGIIITYPRTAEEITVTFLDVGQGDAILIQQGLQQVLIDGGADGQILLERLGQFVPFWDRKIEVVVATHPDQDHIGGLIALADVYRIDTIIETDVANDTGVYDRWKERGENITSIEALRGLNITFPNGAILETVYPLTELPQEYDETNDASVVMQLTYHDAEFLFTGDLSGEKEILVDVEDVDVLKVAHHGSKTSTSAEFLKQVRPQEAIISAGENNRYHHPSEEVMQLLKLNDVQVYETSKKGSVQYSCSEDYSEDICIVQFFN